MRLVHDHHMRAAQHRPQTCQRRQNLRDELRPVFQPHTKQFDHHIRFRLTQQIGDLLQMGWAIRPPDPDRVLQPLVIPLRVQDAERMDF